MYTEKEVDINALEYFKDDLVAKVWRDKYALKDSKDTFYEGSPNDTILRMSTEFARIEKKYKNPLSYTKIYELFNKFNNFILGGSPLFGVGNNYTLSTLGSCFVIDSPLDSYGGIFKTDQELAQLMKRRGGVGFELSTLRYKKSLVNNAASTSTGGVSFADRFSNTTREVAQEGRRGALMLSMLISYPDIVEFITCKDDLKKVTGANISVKVTNEFMQRVEADEDFMLKFNGKDVISIKAKPLWDKLIHQAWKSAEPGILFWDKIISESPADCYEDYKTISTNPCGELPLCAYDSCRLGSINIYAYVLNPFTLEAKFDFDKFAEDVQDCQKLMDDLIDLEEEKINAILTKICRDKEAEEIKTVEYKVWQSIKKKLLNGRRTGLGQMGLGDAGAALGLTYGSSPFIKFAHDVAKTIAINSYISSIQMAEDRGAFVDFNKDTESKNPFLARIWDNLSQQRRTQYLTYGRRNIANLTIAPTGSISMLAGVSSGMEPVFALSYNRKRKVTEDSPNKKFKDPQGDWWEEYEVVHSKFIDWYKEFNWRDDDYIHKGTIEDAKMQWNRRTQEEKDTLISKSPYFNSTAHEVNPYDKLLVQSSIQPWVDHSISVTYNLPEKTTEKEVSDLYLMAWKLGLKGMTVYRDGCRDGILTTNKPTIFNQYDAAKRPKDLICDAYNIKAKGQDWKVFIGIWDNLPYEVFAVNGTMSRVPIERGILRKMSSGVYNFLSPEGETVKENITEHMTPDEEALTRMISWALRHGSKLQFGVEQLDKSKGDITSFSKAIARTLKKYITNGNLFGDNCPDCGAILVNEGGCWVCRSCGYSKCM